MPIDTEALDEQQYGLPSERGKGRIPITRALLLSMLNRASFPLPRMTRIVDLLGTCAVVESSEPPIFELIVESPDLPLSGNDDALPIVDIEARLYSLPRDRIMPHLSAVEYVAVAEWKDRPASRAAALHGGLVGPLSRSAALLAEIDRDGSGASMSYAAMRDVGWIDEAGNGAVPFDSWTDAVASLDEAVARKLLAVTLESLWGRIDVG